MKKQIVNLGGLWFFLFLFCFVGLSRRDAALSTHSTSSIAVLHHRVARVMSLPVSRPVRYSETNTRPRAIISSVWGASVFSVFAVAFVLLWRRCENSEPTETSMQSQSETEALNRVTRRDVLKGGLVLVPTLSFGFSANVILVEPGRLVAREYTIPIKDLPTSLEGLRIAHLSDFHLGDYIGLPHIQRAIAMANEFQPHVALLTGDYVQGTDKSFEPVARTIADELKPMHGYAATLGNHDHWHGRLNAQDSFAKHGIPLIDNDRKFFSVSGFAQSPVAESICIGGIGDLWEDEIDYLKATADAPESMPRLILSHNPDTAEMFSGLSQRKRARAAGPTRVDLMLSGHTHGGQVRLPYLGTPVTPSYYGQKYAGGLVEGPDWRVLISRGLGMAGLPVRLGVPPEVVLVTLVRA